MESDKMYSGIQRHDKQRELEKAVKIFEKKCYRRKDMKDKERITKLREIVEDIIK